MSGPEQNPKLDLSPRDWEEVRAILRECVPDYEVWAFGSRVKGTAEKYSDLDLAIISDSPLSLSTRAVLQDRLDDSNLTIKVDVVDWAATDSFFRDIILQSKVVVQEASTR